MTLLTTKRHLWHQWWLIFLSISLCVFTLPDQSPWNVWQVWHAKQEMLTPRTPDLTSFKGSHFCMAGLFKPILSLSLGLYATWLSDFGVCSFLDNIGKWPGARTILIRPRNPFRVLDPALVNGFRFHVHNQCKHIMKICQCAYQYHYRWSVYMV